MAFKKIIGILAVIVIAACVTGIIGVAVTGGMAI